MNAEEQGSQVQRRMSEQDFYQTLQVDSPWKRMLHWRTCEGERVEGTFCKEEKEKRNSQGQDPRTFDENSQGGDLSTPKTNSQGSTPKTNSHGEDPRTFKEPVDRWRFQKKRKENQWKEKKKK